MVSLNDNPSAPSGGMRLGQNPLMLSDVLAQPLFIWC